MQLVAMVFGFLGFVGWLVFAGSALQLALNHRTEDRSFAWYAVRGVAFFDVANFDENAGPAHRRMLGGIGLFVLGIALSALLTFLANPPA